MAYRIKQIGTNEIADNAVTTPKIADNAVTTDNVADGAITTPKLAVGLQVRQVESEALAVPGESQGSVTAQCNTDEVVTGGGHFLDQDDSQSANVRFSIEEKADPASNSWIVTLNIRIPTTNPFTIKAFAECTKLVDVP